MEWRCNMSIEYGDKLKVNWHNEGFDGDNNGYIYGIYYYDKKICEENPDTDVIDVEWYHNEKIRNREYNGK